MQYVQMGLTGGEGCFHSSLCSELFICNSLMSTVWGLCENISFMHGLPALSDICMHDSSCEIIRIKHLPIVRRRVLGCNKY